MNLLQDLFQQFVRIQSVDFGSFPDGLRTGGGTSETVHPDGKENLSRFRMPENQISDIGVSRDGVTAVKINFHIVY